MDGKTLARIGAIAFVTLAIVASAIEMNRKEDAAVVFAATAKFQPGTDPLAAELGRCSGLGEAGPRDPSCLLAWAANRRRFLGGDSASAQTLPVSAPATGEAH
jgi:conjugative transfer region protein TrbK